MAATVLVSLVVTVVAGALLTRRSLERQAVEALGRQVDLIAAQRGRDGGRPNDGLGEFLATEQQRLAILTVPQAELLLPVDAVSGLSAGPSRSAAPWRSAGTAFSTRHGATVRTRSCCCARPTARRPTGRRSCSGSGSPGSSAPSSRRWPRSCSRERWPVPSRGSPRRADTLRRGSTPAPLPVDGPSEIAVLATSFNELAAELARTQDAERSFLLSVSHELKTPLTVVRGHAEALADEVLQPRAAGPVIEREARRLERLIQDLLDLARLRRHAFSVRAEPVDLGAVAHTVVERYERQSEAAGVGLEAIVEKGAWAQADVDRVVQALSNLVENALRATPRGGRVTVIAAPGRLDVVDDGPGLAEADLERAFERFYLHERQGAGPHVGTGLGLAIVRELAGAMGGTATVHEHRGRRLDLLDPAARPPTSATGRAPKRRTACG